MNISLTNGSGNHPMEPDDCNLQGDIDEHQEIMRSIGLEVVGPAVLVPEGEGYPGSYQVWSPVESDFTTPGGAAVIQWAYVDTEGHIVFLDSLPSADDMRGK